MGPEGRGQLSHRQRAAAVDRPEAVLAWAAESGLAPADAALVVVGAADAAALPEDLRASPSDPWLAGLVHEHLLAPADRRARGAHYTPRPVAEALAGWALSGYAGPDLADRPPTICDPAMGTGAFLLAAAERLVDAGWDRPTAAAALHGADIDPGAVRVARAAVSAWAGAPCAGVEGRLVEGDALVDGAACWRSGAAPFDVVLGNPPFLSQLAVATSRDDRHDATARELLGGRRSGYADTAGLFLLRGLVLTRPGGRTAMLQPLSVLATRDAGPVRAAVAAAGLQAVWIGTEPGFAAKVRVCAPLLAPGEESAAEVAVLGGPDLAPAGRACLPADPAAPWGDLPAVLAGVPAVRLRSAGRVGDLARATAAFRDLFYALAASVREAEAATDLPVVTSGLVDPLASRWGRTPARLGGRRFLRPALPADAVDAMPDRLAAWVRARQVPKLLVATQTRVVEVLADPGGRLVPCTPVVVVEPDTADLWRLAAVLASPPVSVAAARAGAGAALGHDAIKLSARQVLDLPLPGDRSAWDEGAALAEAASAAGDEDRRPLLLELGAVMSSAYGVRGDELDSWWVARLPRRA